MSQEHAEVVCSCGRLWLQVAGICVAMQGDKCRDGDVLARASNGPEYPGYGKPGVELQIWDKDTLEAAAAIINEKVLRPVESGKAGEEVVPCVNPSCGSRMKREGTGYYCSKCGVQFQPPPGAAITSAGPHHIDEHNWLYFERGGVDLIHEFGDLRPCLHVFITDTMLLKWIDYARISRSLQSSADLSTCLGLLREARDLIGGLVKVIERDGLWVKDHACGDCVPGGEIILKDWKCRFHGARDFLARFPAEQAEDAAAGSEEVGR